MRNSTPVDHIYLTIENWTQTLSEREREIFLARLAVNRPRMSLEKLGRRFQVTKERVRQVAVSIEAKFSDFLSSPEGILVQRKASEVRDIIGSASKLSVIDAVLKPSGAIDHRDLILRLAGPYLVQDEWLIRQDKICDDPVKKIVASRDTFGRIDFEAASKALSDWGMCRSFHKDWLLRSDRVMVFQGQLVNLMNVGDKAAFALYSLGRPATLDELKNFYGATGSTRAWANALSRDPRIVRTTIKKVSLADWGHPEYISTPQSMKVILQDSGGSMDIADVVKVVSERFEVKANTVRTYSNAPMFVSRMGKIRLRNSSPYVLPPDILKKTARVFRLGDTKMSILFIVSSGMVRGSGSSIPVAVAQFLGLDLNDEMSFQDVCGRKIIVRFNETTIIGTYVSTLRSYIAEQKISVGDYLVLTLDSGDRTFDIKSIKASRLKPGLTAVGRLIGLEGRVSKSAIAAALGCRLSQIYKVLRMRGDHELMAVYPDSEQTKLKYLELKS